MCLCCVCVYLSLCLCVHGHNDHPLPMCWVCMYFRIGNGGRHTFTGSVTTAPRRDALGRPGVRGGNKRLFRGHRHHYVTAGVPLAVYPSFFQPRTVFLFLFFCFLCFSLCLCLPVAIKQVSKCKGMMSHCVTSVTLLCEQEPAVCLCECMHEEICVVFHNTSIEPEN